MNKIVPIYSINGELNCSISPFDRGFTYGDGVFETCLLKGDELPLWEFHQQRLKSSCGYLGIPIKITQIENYIEQIFLQAPTIVGASRILKIIVSRGCGGRGYQPPDIHQPTICISLFERPKYPERNYIDGIKVRFCDMRLSRNVKLAGHKHLSKLEYVIARSEWSDTDVAEGLLMDENENVIEGTINNLFIVESGVLKTPPLSHCGVSGVMRSLILNSLAPNLGIACKEVHLTKETLFSANEIFVCNSVNGIWPVEAISNMDAAISPNREVTKQLQTTLSESFPQCYFPYS